MKNVIYVTRLIKSAIFACTLFIVFAVALAIFSGLSGCTTLPETIDECGTLYSTMELIVECEIAVLAREDWQHKKKIRLERLDRESRLCTHEGGLYDRGMEYCRSWGML